MSSRFYRFHLQVPARELERWYRGEAHFVVVTTDSGLRVQIPVRHLRPFVSMKGLQGAFQIWLDQNNKLVEIRRLEY